MLNQSEPSPRPGFRRGDDQAGVQFAAVLDSGFRRNDDGCRSTLNMHQTWVVNKPPINPASVHQRQKDILYSSRTRYNSTMAAEVAIMSASFHGNALTGQSLVVSHGRFMQ